MRILFTNTQLDLRAGSELYLLDLARHLPRHGFTLAAFSTELGEVATELRRAGVEVVDRLDSLTAPPDLIHGQHHLETMMAVLHFPGVPALFVCHGAIPWQEMPPRFPRIRRYVAVDDPTRERLRLDGRIEEERIVQILNFVDLERFPARPPLPARPRRALAFSNRASETTFLPKLRAACEARGIALDVAGVDSGRSTPHPEALLPGYDLVFAKARAALEAMAVGCAVVLCDVRGLGPLVTSANFDRLRPLNFGFRALDRPHDSELVAGEISSYDAADAAKVAARVRTETGIGEAISRYAALYAEIVEERRGASTDDERSEPRAAALYLRQIRATLAPPSGTHGEELARLRAERDAWRDTAAWRWRQWLLDRPRLQAVYARLRQVRRG